MRKKLLLVSLITIIIFLFTACSSLNAGQKITLTAECPCCTSEDNVDKMINFVEAKNNDGAQEMINNGEAVILPEGVEVNVIKVGTIVELEAGDGQHLFTTSNSIKYK
jgi:hypothetical protein